MPVARREAIMDAHVPEGNDRDWDCGEVGLLPWTLEEPGLFASRSLPRALCPVLFARSLPCDVG
jgi:hypothetical protein